MPTGLFSHAFLRPDRILFLSNNSLRPSFFTTTGRTSSICSYVVNLLLHLRHSLLRRIELPSLPSLESTTLSSRCPQNGHFIITRNQYTGNLLHKSPTAFRTSLYTPSFPMLLRTVSINSAILSISPSFIPLVVTAGVPILTPLVTIGGLSSKGTAFLFSVIPEASRAVSASLPVMPLFLRSTNIR